MLNQTTVMTLAQEVRAAQQQVTPLTPFTARIDSLSFEDAYAIAYALSSLRVANGERVIGKKIGFTNPDLWAQFKVETPAWGYLYDTDTTQFTDVPLTLSLRPYYQPRIEPEIVFGLRHAPQASANVNDLLAAIEWVALGYEMVQCHYPNWAFQVPDCIADGTFHAAMVIGERIPLTHFGLDAAAILQNLSLTLSCNGDIIETGQGQNVLGSPLIALNHLLQLLAQQDQKFALRAGDIVTTGSLTKAYPVAPGQTWHSTIHGAPLTGLTLTLVD